VGGTLNSIDNDGLADDGDCCCKENDNETLPIAEGSPQRGYDEGNHRHYQGSDQS
jgi:hypothetical protein